MMIKLKLLLILLIIIIVFDLIFFKDSYDYYPYDLVIPIKIMDSSKIIQQKNFLRQYIKFKKMIVIMPNKQKCIYNSKSIVFIDENELVPIKNIIEIFLKLGITNLKRVGWYEQQFLKMAYSRICKDEFYLIWDSDTYPIKPVKMFKNGFPIFDMKTEHHLPYFITINRLFNNLTFVNHSYISEHMLIKTEYMKKLLAEIENNNNIHGKKFYEKILISINKKDIPHSGFSEFETYGLYVDNRYPYVYKHRNWYSRRDMSKYTENIYNLSQYDLKWLSKDYNALTFEKYHKFDKRNHEMITNLKNQRKYTPKQLFQYIEKKSSYK